MITNFTDCYNSSNSR